MGGEKQIFFDIQKIYILVHKKEAGNFSYICNERAWDGFVTVTSGECTFSSENSSDKLMMKGDTVFLRKGERYSFCASEPCSYYTSAFYFSPESSDTLAHFPKFIKFNALQMKSLEKIFDIWEQKSPDSFMFCKIQLLGLYFDIMKKEDDQLYWYKDEVVNSAVEFIHNNFKKNFKSSEIAAYSSSSESHLRTKFLAQTGMTIVQYRDMLRVKTAKELLSSGLFTVKEAAYELGFSDVYYFTKFFTLNVGISPGKYKKNFISQ